MIDELLPYYERELTFIRQMAGEFGEKYPGVAGRLKLEPNTCEDPHVERLIEAFALLAGRVHRKIDDEFPEITESLLDVLYPHYLRPIPSLAIAQFRSRAEPSAVTASTAIPARTSIHHALQNGDTCSFRTAYPVTLWPIRVVDASFSKINRFVTSGVTAGISSSVRIRLECSGQSGLSQLPLDSLRFYINGENTAVQALYESLFIHAVQVTVRAVGGESPAEVILRPGSLRQVGLSADEGLLPYSDRSFLGYRLLQEYFTFPEKFFFFDVIGLDNVPFNSFGRSFEILIALKEADDKHRFAALEQAVDANTFQLGCTPVINIFERIAEPIRISQTKTEYLIVPDQHRQSSTEVYSVERVASLNSYQDEPTVYEPFYCLRHGSSGSNRQFWYTHRRPSLRKNDNGTEVYLSLVDLDFKPSLPAVDMLSLRITCTNRDLASRLKLAGEFGEFEAEGLALVEARCLRKPTSPIRPPLRKSAQWRLISHLSLNHLSIVKGGRDALAEIFRLYDFTDSPVIRKQIAGILDLQSKPAIARVVSETGVTFCRGTDVTMLFDENEYVGGGIYLFASVIERFLGLYSSLNSFSRLTVQTSKGVLKRWPPLAGEQILL
jgi:type VI secretion system protein ImpG